MLHSQMVMAQSIDEAVCNVNTEMNLGLCMKQLDKSHGCTLQSQFGVQDQLVACAALLGEVLAHISVGPDSSVHSRHSGISWHCVKSAYVSGSVSGKREAGTRAPIPG